jgi:rfaE bifunctional protein nucleotidyltransferase chain/domain
MGTSSKIISQRELKEILKWKQLGTVMCLGCFDPLHVGHLNHLEAASNWGDLLIVSVTCDEGVNKGPGRPSQPVEQRARMIAALGFVDYVTDHLHAEQVVGFLQPNVFVKGSEYKGKRIPEQDVLEGYGGKIAYTDEPVMSSTKLLGEVAEVLNAMYQLDVVVIGELITDTYTRCRRTGNTKKHGVPSWTVLDRTASSGGIAASVGHLKDFANDVMRPALAPVVNKERFLDEDGNHFLRLARLPTYRHEDEEAIQVVLDGQFDVLIINDFGHGLISDQDAQVFSKLDAFLAVNAQANSANWGTNTVLKYPAADYVCMNHQELELAGGLEKVRGHFGPDTILAVTTSHAMFFHMKGGVIKQNSLVDRGREGDFVDATGAGDAFFALSSLALAAKATPDLAIEFGAAAAAVTCRWQGNERTITPQEVLEVMNGPQRRS